MAQSVFKEHSFFEEDDTALDEDFAEELEDFSFSALELSGFAESLDFAELLDAVDFTLLELFSSEAFSTDELDFAEDSDFADGSDFSEELLAALSFTEVEDLPFFALLETPSSAEEPDSSSAAEEISSTSEPDAEELESSPQAERQNVSANGSKKSFFIKSPLIIVEKDSNLRKRICRGSRLLLNLSPLKEIL